MPMGPYFFNGPHGKTYLPNSGGEGEKHGPYLLLCSPRGGRIAIGDLNVFPIKRIALALL